MKHIQTFIKRLQTKDHSPEDQVAALLFLSSKYQIIVQFDVKELPFAVWRTEIVRKKSVKALNSFFDEVANLDECGSPQIINF